MHVKAKKHLGQHFLKDNQIAYQIVQALTTENCPQTVLEVGPGTGMLTQYLVQEKNKTLWLAEVDDESVLYLNQHYPKLIPTTLHQSFLELDFKEISKNPIAVIGNFPYNISSQIVFKVLDNYAQIPLMVGMFQKEVAMRLCAKPKHKDYGILTVLAQTYYNIEYLFTVDEHVFNPPPKVKSAVVRFKVKDVFPDCDLNLMRQVVKTAFNQRRKKLRNALSSFNIPDEYLQPFINCRAEELDLASFTKLTNLIKQHTNGDIAGK